MHSVIIDMKNKMSRVLEFTKNNTSKLRTGKVNINLIKYINFNYSNIRTYLYQVTSISVLDYNSLLITIWDKSLLVIIKKAILDNKDLGINPIDYGDNLLVKFPPMTEESRLNVVKILKKDIEKSKVSIRAIRMEYIKIIKMDKNISKDDMQILLSNIDYETNDFIKKINIIYEMKKNEILSV
jgi:ribosome recycling factor